MFILQIPVYQHLIMPPPKETPIIEEPEVISEIRTSSEKKRRPTLLSHMRASFVSLGSRRPSITRSVRKSGSESGA